MKLHTLLIIILFVNTSYSQQKVFYINIPLTLKQGTIAYNLHTDSQDSTFVIFFNGLPGMDRDAGFYLTCKKAFTKKQGAFYNSTGILTPEMVADSLNKIGRSFFRKNLFYALFIQGDNYYLHKAKGEYAYMNYKNE